MTPEEVQALAQRIADFLSARAEPGRAPGSDPDPGSAARPPAHQGKKPRARGREDVGWYRAAYGELTAAARAAAAGSGPSPRGGGVSKAPSRNTGAHHSVPVAVSNRHIHLCQADVYRLFGAERQLTPDRPIEQPGQFAAHERVRVVGPAGAIADVRVVGPARQATQVELAASDAHAIGVSAPIRASGVIAGSAPVRLEGPTGAIDLPGGAIVAARHLHVSVADGARMGVSDGDRVTLLIGSGDRRATVHDVLVRLGKGHATELHIDTDEARAYGVGRGATAVLVGRGVGGGGGGGGRARAMPQEGGRRVVTERDVEAIAAAGRSLSRGPGCIITPAAIDRAKAFGIWRE